MDQHPLPTPDQERSDFKVWFYVTLAVCALLIIGFIWLLITHPFWAIGTVIVLCTVCYWLYSALGRMIDGASKSIEPSKEVSHEEIR